MPFLYSFLIFSALFSTIFLSYLNITLSNFSNSSYLLFYLLSLCIQYCIFLSLDTLFYLFYFFGLMKSCYCHSNFPSISILIIAYAQMRRSSPIFLTPVVLATSWEISQNFMIETSVSPRYSTMISSPHGYIS